MVDYMKTKLIIIAKFPDGSIMESEIPKLWIQREADSNKPDEGYEPNELPQSVEEIINAKDIRSKGEQKHYIEAFTCGTEFSDFKWHLVKPSDKKKTRELLSILWTNNADRESIEPKLKIVAR